MSAITRRTDIVSAHGVVLLASLLLLRQRRHFIAHGFETLRGQGRVLLRSHLTSHAARLAADAIRYFWARMILVDLVSKNLVAAAGWLMCVERFHSVADGPAAIGLEAREILEADWKRVKEEVRREHDFDVAGGRRGWLGLLLFVTYGAMRLGDLIPLDAPFTGLGTGLERRYFTFVWGVERAEMSVLGWKTVVMAVLLALSFAWMALVKVTAGFSRGSGRMHLCSFALAGFGTLFFAIPILFILVALVALLVWFVTLVALATVALQIARGAFAPAKQRATRA